MMTRPLCPLSDLSHTVGRASVVRSTPPDSVQIKNPTPSPCTTQSKPSSLASLKCETLSSGNQSLQRKVSSTHLANLCSLFMHHHSSCLPELMLVDVSLGLHCLTPGHLVWFARPLIVVYLRPDT